MAEQLAAKLNTRLNYQPPEELANSGNGDSTPFLIESTIPQVQKKREISRILKEEMIKIHSSAQHMGSKGRYKVL